MDHTDSELDERLDRIEAQLDLLSRRAGVPYERTPRVRFAGDVPASVIALVQAGKRMEAITEIRRLTGVSAVDAKSIVDGL